MDFYNLFLKSDFYLKGKCVKINKFNQKIHKLNFLNRYKLNLWILI